MSESPVRREPGLVGRLLPGLRPQHTVSGATIEVSANGTTSVAGGELTTAVLKRFRELRAAAPNWAAGSHEE